MLEDPRTSSLYCLHTIPLALSMLLIYTLLWCVMSLFATSAIETAKTIADSRLFQQCPFFHFLEITPVPQKKPQIFSKFFYIGFLYTSVPTPHTILCLV